MSTRSLPARASGHAPRRVAVAATHLAALGIVGVPVVAVLTALLAVTVALAPILGIGLLPFAALVSTMYGVARFETARADGLLDRRIPRPAWRPSEQDGLQGFVRRLLWQAREARVWAALANFLIGTLLGVVLLVLAVVLVSASVFAFAPLYADGSVGGPFGADLSPAWACVAGIACAAGAAAAIAALAILHCLVSAAILVPSREEQLAAHMRTSDTRRASAVRASEVERTRIERDLHDGVQPRLVSVGMTLGLARNKIDDDPVAAKALIEEAHSSTKAAVSELRQLARGIHASVLHDQGLDAALSALAELTHMPVHLDVHMSSRCSREAETAVYFAIAESLTNSAKHARASECRVHVRIHDDGMVRARIEDDGLGAANVVPGGGLDGVSNRMLAVGGTFQLFSPDGGPTVVEVSAPCAS